MGKLAPVIVVGGALLGTAGFLVSQTNGHSLILIAGLGVVIGVSIGIIKVMFRRYR